MSRLESEYSAARRGVIMRGRESCDYDPIRDGDQSRGSFFGGGMLNKTTFWIG